MKFSLTQLSKMIQSGGFLTGTVINPEKEISKTADGLGSLMATLVKE